LGPNRDKAHIFEETECWNIVFMNAGDPHPDANSAVKSNAVSISFFDDILKWLKASDIQVITVADGCEMLIKVQGK